MHLFLHSQTLDTADVLALWSWPGSFRCRRHIHCLNFLQAETPTFLLELKDKKKKKILLVAMCLFRSFQDRMRTSSLSQTTWWTPLSELQLASCCAQGVFFCKQIHSDRMFLLVPVCHVEGRVDSHFID